jgi:4-hydroxybenzoate polyprenyltransferase
MDNSHLGARVRAYLDLTRIHFAIVWPLLFGSGAVLAFARYGGFSWELLAKAFLIGFFGFEAGMVLNDVIDQDVDKRDVDPRLTRYWRPFKTRPLSQGLLPRRLAIATIVVFALVAAGLAATLPLGNAVCVIGLMLYAYGMESFYQLKKRHQRLPLAQLLGRTDFALFPIAGYLCVGVFDWTAALYLLFFYPFALVHLGINDLVDVENDVARGMRTVTTMYGLRGTAVWITVMAAAHLAVSVFFIQSFRSPARFGFVVAAGLLIFVTAAIVRRPSPARGLAVLPVFHATLFVYLVSMYADFFLLGGAA